MYTVLFICTANICRTPMAVAYAKQLIKKDNLTNSIRIESAGTWAEPGHPADPVSETICEENDLDASGHRARQVDLNLLNQADLVLCMTENQRDDLRTIFPHYSEKIYTLKEYANPQSLPVISIADPHRKDILYYRTAFKEISQEIERFWPEIKKNAG